MLRYYTDHEEQGKNSEQQNGRTKRYKTLFFLLFLVFKLDFQRNELLSTTVFLTGHKKHFNSFVRVVFFAFSYLFRRAIMQSELIKSAYIFVMQERILLEKYYGECWCFKSL